jgi:hyperosmotically inducible protein
MHDILRMRRLFLPISTLILLLSVIVVPASRGQDPRPTPDNTRTNKDQSGQVADQQKMTAADGAITKQIRKAIHHDNTLSTYAHNIKIITQDGKVTLRGPVRSDEERNDIEAKAVAVAGKDNVTNQLEIAPPNTLAKLRFF